MKFFIHVLILHTFLTFSLNGQNYTLYSIGNSNSIDTGASFGICLMGGATESDEAMKWFLSRANGGDVVVLRTSGSDGYNSYFYSSLGVSVNSVKSFVCHNRNASYDSNLISAIENAEAIWFAGGNQWNYISYWRNTPIDSIINLKIQQKEIAIGGTSAGMAILGSYYFSAQNGSVTSATSLNNPFDSKVTLDTNQFIKIPFLESTITDTHYDNPDRKGRHSVFLARGLSATGNHTKGIACDEYTAVCIDSSGIARVFGGFPTYDDNAYFIQSNCEISNPLPETLSPSTPLTWFLGGKALKVYNIKGDSAGNNSFDLNTWQTGTGGSWENWSIQSGSISFSSGLAPNCNSTVVASKQNNQFTVYPNPFSDCFNVYSEMEIIQIQIVSPVGKVRVLENKNQICIENEAPGIYFVRCFYEEGSFTKKIIKD